MERLLSEDELQVYDALLLQAVFSPAIKTGQIKMVPETAIELQTGLLDLSEFYIGRNDTLSAALHSVWDCMKHEHRLIAQSRRSLLDILFTVGKESRAEKNRFAAYRGLVATAVIQYADGNATTFITQPPSKETYHAAVTKALEFLELVT